MPAFPASAEARKVIRLTGYKVDGVGLTANRSQAFAWRYFCKLINIAYICDI